MASGKKLPKLLKWCYKVSWCGKMTATQSSTIANRLKEYSCTLFRHVFWKRTFFDGVPVVGFLGFLVPKVHWGVKKMRKEKFLKGKPSWPFPFNICEPILSNLLPLAQLFLNLATRWRPSTTESCKTLLILTWTKVLKVCRLKKTTFLSILICIKFNICTNTSFSNQCITHESEFFQFYDTGV